MYCLFIWLIFISLFIGLVEGIPLARKKMHKELFTIISLLAITLLLSLIKTIGLSTPIELINNLLEPIGRAFFKIR